MNRESIAVLLRGAAHKVFCLFLCFLGIYGIAQQSDINPYGLEILNDTLVYRQVILSDSNQKMVEVSEHIPGIMLDIRYATASNFTGKVIYSAPRAFVRLAVAKALASVEEDLGRQGLGLKIFDAYRPYAATLLFYQTLKDTVFCAPPWKGSRHNRGCAVDVTLVNRNTGEELEMPTPYDEFSARAHPSYSELPKKAILNRGLLIRLMQKYGFTVFPDEWWHFDFMGWEKYGLMDLSFEFLDKVK